MTIEIKPETERLVRSELENGHFESIDELIVKGIHALHDGEEHPFTREERKTAIRQMREFIDKNRVGLAGTSIKELLHEGHRM
jgi:Arc/MetJ-type ribon-helix-helix transcriptional regulator